MGDEELVHRFAEGFAYGDDEQTSARKLTTRESFLAPQLAHHSRAIIQTRALLLLTPTPRKGVFHHSLGGRRLA